MEVSASRQRRSEIMWLCGVQSQWEGKRRTLSALPLTLEDGGAVSRRVGVRGLRLAVMATHVDGLGR
jgi:hypothetical protein